MKAIERAFPAFLLNLSLITFFCGSLFAQESKGDTPSDAELEQYVEVEFALKEIRRERQNKMMEILKNSELGIQGYRKVDTKQNDEKAEVPEEKQKAYEAIKKKVKALQEKYRKKEVEKMKEMGMKPERYREISRMKKKKEVRDRMIRIKEQKMEEAQKESGN